MLYLLVFVCSLVFSSCAVVAHMDQAMVLKDYSDNKDDQAAYVADCSRKFDELLSAVKAGSSFREYSRKPDFIARFGEPVLTQVVQLPEGQPEERLLYRYPTRYFDGLKVYVFFDTAGQLKRVEHVGKGAQD
ncbi:MAG: hypothetical protein HGA80_08680 [Candidatus Omnitrophica bacterium]|nr:hypothetical protein [Candidatus Omnitrophota bacterium]